MEHQGDKPKSPDPLAVIEPVAVEQKDPWHISIGWRDGKVTVLDGRALRLACPCAMCVDEITRQPLLDPKTVPEKIRILGTDVVGRYALRFRFSDNHDTGIFTFPLLRQLGESPQ
jgi:ATP-binding protein involved in chromosome partitioning